MTVKLIAYTQSTDVSAQKEHRAIAQACWAIVVDAVPALGEVEI